MCRKQFYLIFFPSLSQFPYHDCLLNCLLSVFFQVYFRFTGCLTCPPAVGALILAQPSLSSSVREGSVLLVFSIFAVSK